MTCTTAPVQSGGVGISNKTSCINDGDVPVAAQQLSSTPLAPYSIEDPVPGPDDCTLSSIFHPQWTFSSFEVDSAAAHGNNASSSSSSSSVSFDIILQTGTSGFQFPISMTQGNATSSSQVAGDGTQWYHCVIGAAGDTGPALWPTACSFTYQPATKRLALRADWSCSDLDPSHP